MRSVRAGMEAWGWVGAHFGRCGTGGSEPTAPTARRALNLQPQRQRSSFKCRCGSRGGRARHFTHGMALMMSTPQALWTWRARAGKCSD